MQKSKSNFSTIISSGRVNNGLRGWKAGVTYVLGFLEVYKSGFLIEVFYLVWTEGL